VLISSAFSSGTSPMNFSVMCAPSMRAHRAFRHTPRNFATSASIAWRTSSGISNATKSRMGSALHAALGLRRVEKIPAYQVERRLRCLPADAVPFAGEDHAAFFVAGSVRDGDVHRAHG